MIFTRDPNTTTKSGAPAGPAHLILFWRLRTNADLFSPLPFRNVIDALDLPHIAASNTREIGECIVALEAADRRSDREIAADAGKYFNVAPARVAAPARRNERRLLPELMQGFLAVRALAML